MGTIAQFFSVLQHQNMIRVQNGADPLGNHNGGHIPIVFPQRLSERCIRPVIQRAGRIVQNQDFRIPGKSACQQYPLFLPAAEIGSPGRQHMGKPVRQALNKLHSLRTLGSLHNSFVGQISPEINIGFDGIGKENVILEYDTEFGVELLRWNGLYRLSVNADTAAVPLIQPHEQGRNGAFSASRAADNTQCLPFFSRNEIWEMSSPFSDRKSSHPQIRYALFQKPQAPVSPSSPPGYRALHRFGQQKRFRGNT